MLTLRGFARRLARLFGVALIALPLGGGDAMAEDGGGIFDFGQGPRPAQTRPAEARPAEARPAEARPVETGTTHSSRYGVMITRATPTAPAQKHAVPSTTEQARAEAILKEMYKSDYARTAPADRRALARRLLAQMKQVGDDPVSQYVVLREARDLAADAGDGETVLSAAKQITARYVASAGDVFPVALGKCLRATIDPNELATIARGTMALIREQMQAEDFDAVGKLVPIMTSAASRCRQADLAAEAQALARDVAVVKAEREKCVAALHKLQTDANDPRANLEVGKYYCLFRGDWTIGLPYLARCSVAKFKTAAAFDLSRPGTARAKVAVAESWWAASESETGLAARRLQERAAWWYHEALPELSGLERVAAQKRIAAAPAIARARDNPTPPSMTTIAVRDPAPADPMPPEVRRDPPPSEIRRDPTPSEIRRDPTPPVVRRDPPPLRPRRNPPTRETPRYTVAKGTNGELLGGDGGVPYRQLAGDGQVLAGFEVQFNASGRRNVTSFHCIYRSGSNLIEASNVAGQKSFAALGDPIRVIARDDYAVGALIVRSSVYVEGFSVVFMRIKGDRLDPTDSYTSDWIGDGPPGRTTTLGGDGTPIVGIHGGAGLVMDSLGIVTKAQ